jgi:hypothetical protein
MRDRGPHIANDDNGFTYTEMDSRDNTLTGVFVRPMGLRNRRRGGDIVSSASRSPGAYSLLLAWRGLARMI